jgi:adenosine deaminase CECR1
VKHFDLSWTEVVEIGRNSLLYSFAEPELKRELLRRYESGLAAFEARFDRPDWRQALPRLEVRKSGYSRRHLGL